MNPISLQTRIPVCLDNSATARVAHGYGTGWRGPTWTRTHKTRTRTGMGTNPHPLTRGFRATPRVPVNPYRYFVILLFFHALLLVSSFFFFFFGVASLVFM